MTSWGAQFGFLCSNELKIVSWCGSIDKIIVN